MTNRVRELRKLRNLSQEDFGQAVGGVTRQTVASIEEGRYNPSLPLAFAIARFFNLNVEEVFLYNVDNPA